MRINRISKRELLDALEKGFMGLRLVGFFSICVLVIVSAFSSLAQTRKTIPPLSQITPEVSNVLNTLSIENEHRFTHLETTVAEIYKQVSDIRTNSWIALLGILGLAGETGIRLGKRLTSRQQQ